jgi:hypothetical protein
LIAEIRLALRLAKGYRMCPWRSPYLRWRMETWSGIDAASITPGMFIGFVWKHRADLMRYLRWAVENRAQAEACATNRR